MGRQIIDFSDFNPPKEKFSHRVSVHRTTEEREQIDNLSDSLQLLNKMYPCKILFTFEEVAKILNVGIDFVRRRCLNGTIPYKKFGDKKMVHVLELSRLIKDGTD